MIRIDPIRLPTPEIDCSDDIDASIESRSLRCRVYTLFQHSLEMTSRVRELEVESKTVFACSTDYMDYMIFLDDLTSVLEEYRRLGIEYNQVLTLYQVWSKRFAHRSPRAEAIRQSLKQCLLTSFAFYQEVEQKVPLMRS